MLASRRTVTSGSSTSGRAPPSTRSLRGSLRRRAHELAEQRLGARGPRVELGVELGGDEEGVVGELDDLDQPLVRRGPAGHEALVLEPAPKQVVDLVTMAVALVDHRLAEDLPRPRAVVELHRVRAEPHRPPHVGDLLLLGQQVDHREGGLRVELGRVGTVHPRHVAGELDHGRLHPEADAEIRDVVLARDARRLDLALDPAVAEAAGDEDPVGRGQRSRSRSSELTSSTSTLVP